MQSGVDLGLQISNMADVDGTADRVRAFSVGAEETVNSERIPPQCVLKYAVTLLLQF